MSNLTIRVGASVDRSVGTAFKTVTDAARAADNVVTASTKKTTMLNSEAMARTLVEKRVADGKKLHAEEMRNFERENRKKDASLAKSRRENLSEDRRAAVEKRRNDALSARSTRLSEKRLAAKKKEDQGTSQLFVGGAIGAAVVAGKLALDGVTSVARFGASVLRDVAAGAGVQMDLASAVAGQVSLESAAANLSNQAFQPGNEGRAGRRVDPGLLVAQANMIGNETGYSANDVISGMTGFTAKTGDLGASRDIVKDLAVLAKATGTNLQDMVTAAGDVYSALGDIPDKGEAIVQVMRTMAGQGKIGAVEIKDMATQMAKLGANAGKFEGNAADNMISFGAFAQVARKHGGSASAEQAATATSAFANVFSKNARFNKFKEIGIDVNSSSEEGKFRDPKEIIIEALQKTAGKNQQQKMTELFGEVRAQKVTSGFANIFSTARNNAEGSEKERLAIATKAVREELERFTNAAMTREEELAALAIAMGTTESKVTILNNQYGKAANEMLERVFPIIQKLAPQMLELMGPMALLAGKVGEVAIKLANWAAQLTGAHDESEERRAAETLKHSDAWMADVEAGIMRGEVIPGAENMSKENIFAIASAKKILTAKLERQTEEAEPKVNWIGGGVASAGAANVTALGRSAPDPEALAAVNKTKSELFSLLLAEGKANDLRAGLLAVANKQLQATSRGKATTPVAARGKPHGSDSSIGGPGRNAPATVY